MRQGSVQGERLEVGVMPGSRQTSPRAMNSGEALLHSVLDRFQCHLEWEEDKDKGLWTVYVPEIDDWGQGASREEAVKDLVASAKDLAEAYMSQVTFFLKGGRSSEFPYLLRISLATDDNEVRQVLGLGR